MKNYCAKKLTKAIFLASIRADKKGKVSNRGRKIRD